MAARRLAEATVSQQPWHIELSWDNGMDGHQPAESGHEPAQLPGGPPAGVTAGAICALAAKAAQNEKY